MAITLIAMRDEVKLALVQRSDVDSNIDGWLNDAQLMLATQLRIRELESGRTLTAVAATRDGNNLVTGFTDIYSVPGDFWVPLYLKNKGTALSPQNMEIKLKALDVVLKRDPEPVGRPDIYAIRGKTFIFRQAFDLADVIELTYKLKVPNMTNISPKVDMTLPDEFRRVVVMDALAYAMFILQEEERAAVYIGLRDAELKKLGDQRGEESWAREEGTILKWDGREGAKTAHPLR